MAFEISQLFQYCFLASTLILPGLACLLAFKNKINNFWQNGIVFLAPVISIAILSFPIYIAFLLKANLIFLSYIFLVILLLSSFFVIFKLQGKRISLLLFKRADTLYYFLLFCLFIGIAYVISDAVRINTVFGADSLFHLSKINKFITRLEAGNFSPITGEIIDIGKSYMNNFYHLLIATLSILTGLKAVNIWYFFEYMNLFLLLAIAYSFSKLFFSRFASFVLVCIIFGTTFFLLDYRPNYVATQSYTIFHPYLYLFLNYQNSYVEKILFLSILFLLFLYKNEKISYAYFLILTVLILFSAAGIHLASAFLLFVGVGIFLIASLFSRKLSFSSMQWRKVMFFLGLAIISFLPYILSILSFKNPVPVQVSSAPEASANLGDKFLLLGENFYMVDPRIYLHILPIAIFVAPIILFFLTKKKVWLLFGAYIIGKYVLVLFNPIAHYFSFLILGQHAKLFHFVGQDFVEKFLIVSLIIVIVGRIAPFFKNFQFKINRKVFYACAIILFFVLIPTLSTQRKKNADQLLLYSPYSLSYQETINGYLYGKNVTVLSDITTSRYLTSYLGNNIVGTLSAFNASTTENNASRQLDAESLMGATSFDNFLLLLKKYKVNYIYINNEVGLDNSFITNRLKMLNDFASNPKIADLAVKDNHKILYAIRWDKLDENTLPSLKNEAQMKIDKRLREPNIDLEELIDLLKLADAFSLKNENILSRIIRDYHIDISDIKLPVTDTIEVEMKLAQHFQANKQIENEMILYSEILDTYSEYDTYPDRIYSFIHDVVGFPQEIPALDLKDRYAVTSIKVKNNRELVNYLVNTYIQSGLYERAIEIGNQYRLADPNYEYLNDRLREASNQLNQKGQPL